MSIIDVTDISTVLDVSESSVSIDVTESETVINIEEDGVDIAVVEEVIAVTVFDGDSVAVDVVEEEVVVSLESDYQLTKADIEDKLTGEIESHSHPGSGGGHTIQDEGSSLTNRLKINFVGDAVEATDDAVNNATIVTINNPVYTGTAERNVGGIAEGAVFDAATMTEMWDALIKEEKFPILTAPSSTFVSDYTGYREIGEIITSITFNASFDRGSISPQYDATSPYRSGLPNQYTYTGGTLSNQASSMLTDIQTESGWTVISGAQSWTCRVAYDAGVQPTSSYGNDYSTPLAAGSTSVDTQTITGVYPWYGTTSVIGALTKQSLTSMSSSYAQTDMVAEDGVDKQRAEFPQAWSTITGIQLYNTLAGTWDWIGGSKANSLTTFIKTASTETVQGNVIDYWLYTHNGATTGARKLRWYTI